MRTRTGTGRRPRPAPSVVDPCATLPITVTDLIADLDPGWLAWREGRDHTAREGEAA